MNDHRLPIADFPPYKFALRINRPWIAILLVCLGLAPLMYWHVVGLLERPHYQFLLLLPVAVWMLVTSRPQEDRSMITPRDRLASVGLLLFSICSLAVATWAWSPWIAAISGLLAFLGLALYTGGWHQTLNMLPAWLFCWILIPLPFGMDEDLIVRLRTITTRMTSATLDQMGILHQSYANVIELPGKPLFVADACSGIHSLYVLMAMALFLSLFHRRSVFHTALLLASTFALVLVENVSRIVSVAVALGWHRDISVGVNHTMLGVVLFCASALLILTTDQLLLFLLPDRPFQSFAAKFRKRDVIAMTNTGSAKVFRWPMEGAVTWSCLVVCFPILGIAQLTRLPNNAPSLAKLFPSDFQLPKFGEEALPSELSGFTRESYETIDRVAGDPFGKSSQRWIYRKGALTVGISIDYPYNGIKDLCDCYLNVGWQITNTQLLDHEQRVLANALEAVESPIAKSSLFRDLFGNGLLLFSSCDLTGKTGAFIKDLKHGDVEQRAGDRFLTFGKQQEGGTRDEFQNPPYIQVHLLARSFEKLDPVSESELISLFIDARKRLTSLVVSAAKPKLTGADQNGVR